MALCYYKTRNVDIWRLEELDAIIDEFDSDLCNSINNAHIKANNDYTNIVIFLAGKAILKFREVITLCSMGYPDGALALARNMYEKCIILAFLNYKSDKADFQDIVDDFHADYNIHRCKALKKHLENYNNNEDELQKISDELETAKEKAHKKASDMYWWSGYPTFSALEKNVLKNISADLKELFEFLHFTYLRACSETHSGSFGDSNRLCNMKEHEFYSGPSETGHDIPLAYATMSFIFIVGIACDALGMKYDKYIESLNDLAVFYNNKLIEAEEKLLKGSGKQHVENTNE